MCFYFSVCFFPSVCVCCLVLFPLNLYGMCRTIHKQSRGCHVLLGFRQGMHSFNANAVYLLHNQVNVVYLPIGGQINAAAVTLNSAISGILSYCTHSIKTFSVLKLSSWRIFTSNLVMLWFITSRVINLVFAVRIGRYDALFFRLQFMALVLRRPVLGS